MERKPEWFKTYDENGNSLLKFYSDTLRGFAKLTSETLQSMTEQSEIMYNMGLTVKFFNHSWNKVEKQNMVQNVLPALGNLIRQETHKRLMEVAVSSFGCKTNCEGKFLSHWLGNKEQPETKAAIKLGFFFSLLQDAKKLNIMFFDSGDSTFALETIFSFLNFQNTSGEVTMVKKLISAVAFEENVALRQNLYPCGSSGFYSCYDLKKENCVHVFPRDTLANIPDQTQFKTLHILPLSEGFRALDKKDEPSRWKPTDIVLVGASLHPVAYLKLLFDILRTDAERLICSTRVIDNVFNADSKDALLFHKDDQLICIAKSWRLIHAKGGKFQETHLLKCFDLNFLKKQKGYIGHLLKRTIDLFNACINTNIYGEQVGYGDHATSTFIAYQELLTTIYEFTCNGPENVRFPQSTKYLINIELKEVSFLDILRLSPRTTCTITFDALCQVYVKGSTYIETVNDLANFQTSKLVDSIKTYYYGVSHNKNENWNSSLELTPDEVEDSSFWENKKVCILLLFLLLHYFIHFLLHTRPENCHSPIEMVLMLSFKTRVLKLEMMRRSLLRKWHKTNL